MTPAMQQYLDIKAEYQDHLVLFRMGDFYETFYEDAKTASRILNITLTARDKERKVPMAGIPFHALDNYLIKLINVNQKVVIVEQLEDPKEAKGVVKRGIVRIVTSGTSDISTHEKQNNYLASVVQKKDKNYHLAYIDLNEGIIYHSDYENLDEIINYLILINAREVLIPNNFLIELPEKFSEILGSRVTALDFSKLAQNDFRSRLSPAFVSNYEELIIDAIWLILNYLSETQRTQLAHIHSLASIKNKQVMSLDNSTVRNLELIEGLRPDSVPLAFILDECCTTTGSKLLRKWLLEPSLLTEEIDARLDAVECFNALDQTKVENLREQLCQLYDINRICARIGLLTANARDLRNLVISYQTSAQIFKFLSEINLTPYLARHLEIAFNLLEGIQEQITSIDNKINENPPLTVRDGEMFKKGIFTDLDELRGLRDGSKEWIDEFEKSEIKRSGINTLRVKFNKVFGFYIEISKGQSAKVPDNYIRKQTLVNAERFITPELKQRENDVLSADVKIKKLEYDFFLEILKQTQIAIPQLQKLSSILAEIDLLLNFSVISQKYNWTRPKLNESSKLMIEKGRHPVIELLLQKEGKDFVTNDLEYPKDVNLFLITGPNMGGKSTYIRQNALIVLLAHTGCFVPAQKALIPITDAVFSRVGASDNLARGESTFMVEMLETARILKSATSRSLIILDEVGRGTSTFDGISLAWAICEELIKLKSRTLFATHYHELTELANKFPVIRNLAVKVSEFQNDIIFMHKVAPGKVDRSYGIHVAKLAGLPDAVTARAVKILKLLEKDKSKLSPRPQELFENIDEEANNLSNNGSDELKKHLLALNLEEITPIKALQILNELKQKASEV